MAASRFIYEEETAQSRTPTCQGGIRRVTSKEDSSKLHVRDTLEPVPAYARKNVVPPHPRKDQPRIAELIALGMQVSEREIPR